MCNCKLTELVTGIVVILLALWPNILGYAASKWVLAVAGAILILHSLMCKDIACCKEKAKPKAKKRKR